MDLFILGFMVTDYLKDIGFDGATDTQRVRDVVNAYVQGYAMYVKEKIVMTINVIQIVREDNSLFIVLEKEK